MIGYEKVVFIGNVPCEFYVMIDQKFVIYISDTLDKNDLWDCLVWLIRAS